ncbi:MAG: type III-A CRISPR-associated RAMP protein Csm4 [Ignavibacteriaceae bacterium]
MKYLFELNFKTSVHIGSDIAGLGVEGVQGFAHSDTLFSALMNVIISSKNTFNYIWLNEFLSGKGKEINLPFKISSFGFVKYIEDEYRYFIPKPLLVPDRLVSKADYNNWKHFKNLKYITLERYQDILDGKQLDLELISEKESDTFWVDQIRDQIQMDVLTAATKIYSMGEIFYEKSVKPFLIIELNESELPLNDLIVFLRLLGNYGLGGRRTVGSGVFSFTDEDWFCIDPATKDEVRKINPNFNFEKNTGRVRFKEIFSFPSNTKYLFSTLFPVNAAEKEILNYNLITRKGWIFSTSSFNQLKRKTCYMIGEGSILNKEIIGSLVDVTPKVFSDHRVWRYGIPFYLPFTDLR